MTPLPPDRPSATASAIVLYDGSCGLCERVMRAIRSYDRVGYFRCIPLQSDEAAQLLRPYAMDPLELSSVIVIHDGGARIKADAVLSIARHLGGPWLLLRPLYLLPKSWLRGGYNWVARHRKRWFGGNAACSRP